MNRILKCARWAAAVLSWIGRDPFAHTLVGVLFGWLIAIWSFDHEEEKRDAAMLNAAHFELDSNIPRLEFVIRSLEHELGVLEQNRSITDPMPFMHTDVWQSMLISVPDKLFLSPKLFRDVATTYESLSIINERLASRESYRHGAITTTRSQALAAHDEGILEFARIARDEIKAAKTALLVAAGGTLAEFPKPAPDTPDKQAQR